MTKKSRNWRATLQRSRIRRGRRAVGNGDRKKHKDRKLQCLFYQPHHSMRFASNDTRFA